MEGHQLYVPLKGHQLYVPLTWLSDVQGAFKGKTKSCAFKLMIDCFFEPHEMVGKTGCKVADSPLGKALKGLFFCFCFFMMIECTNQGIDSC